MPSSRVAEIAATILEHSPTVTSDGRRVALATHRLLAGGAPVGGPADRGTSGLEGSAVQALQDSRPGVFRNDAQPVVGSWDLSIAELWPHGCTSTASGVRLCAWDTLFLPALLGQPADVRSRSPLDGEPITVRVSPGDRARVTAEPRRLDGPRSRVRRLHPQRPPLVRAKAARRPAAMPQAPRQ